MRELLRHVAYHQYLGRLSQFGVVAKQGDGSPTVLHPYSNLLVNIVSGQTQLRIIAGQQEYLGKGCTVFLPAETPHGCECAYEPARLLLT
ncbi:cupin domain-containing protein [Novosphingobium sp. AP12]|uniref:cupin domain-containing protein n=1 Tax=Novosphingobium sp. AP12 TaxID=1144305 RepID=UPI0012FA393B